MAESTHKTVYLIRHAESEENRRLGSLKSVGRALRSFSLPSSSDVSTGMEFFHFAAQVNSNISSVGEQQILEMSQKLQEANFLREQGIELVLHSPLERARQTCKGLLGCLAPDLKRDPVNRVEELDFLREKYPSEWIPGNYQSFADRIQMFESWLDEQPERCVAVVGHSQYFKAMLKLDFKFGNCDVWKAKFSGKEWTNVEPVYTCRSEGPPKEHDSNETMNA